jgi:SAM-dependent methyltransferase
MNNINHEIIFTSIYENCLWGDNKNLEYKGSSGFGSKLDLTQPVYIPFLKNFIVTNEIESIVDIGCGDFIFSKKIFDDIKNIKYVGYDIYKDLINYHNKTYKDSDKYKFIHLDILEKKDEIVNGDLFIIKEVFQHWTNNEIEFFLKFIIKNKKFKYILITNTCSSEENSDLRPIISPSQKIDSRFRPLSAKFHPLKQFNPIILFLWGKEITYEWNNKWFPYRLETSLIVNNL